MKNRSSVGRYLFLFSVLFLVFIYGAGVGRWQWFPYSFLKTAEDQARAVMNAWTAEGISLRSAVYRHEGVRTPSPDRMQSGLTLVTSSWQTPNGWKPGLKLFDEEGDVLHEWMVDRGRLFEEGARRNPELTEIHGSHLLPNGDVVINLEYVGMARLDACGEVKWTLQEGNHHSIERSEDGTFWVPGVSQTLQIGSERYPDGFPGLGGKEVWVDRILHVSADGDVLDEFNVLDVLYQNGLERYIPKYMDGRHPKKRNVREDITHVNDVEPLDPSMASEYPFFDAGDLLVSARIIDLVMVVDPETKKVKWHTSDPFIHQHDPDFTGNGWIGVFDNNEDTTNRGTMLGGSRIVAIQPHTDSTVVRFPTKKSDHFFTHIQGKWQTLENGNMLLVEAVAGRVVEVAPDGRTVWEWIYPPTSDSNVPSVKKATRLDLTKREVASWPCSSADSVRTTVRK